MQSRDHIFFALLLRTAGGVFIGRALVMALLLPLAMPMPGCDKSEPAAPRQNAGGLEDPMHAEQGSPPESPSRTVRWTPDGGERFTVSDAPVAMPDLAPAPAPGWSIVLVTITDPNHRDQAMQWMRSFRDLTGLNGAWIDSSERGSIVRYGRYESSSSPQAQADLRQFKSTEVGGVIPFRTAYLARHGSATPTGRLRELNLPEARKLYPGVETLYTLQIAVYEAERDTTAADARRLAEEAALQLRAQNELAFYYHGPNRSHVCVGVFAEGAVDPATGLYSPEVQALQERFPHNAYNGRTIEERITGLDGQVRQVRQRSFLVVVPKE